MTQSELLVDSHGRVLRDLRVSLTDRCNFRCLYCLPETEATQNFYRGRWAHMPDSPPLIQQWVPRSNLLSFEEIERVVLLAAFFFNDTATPESYTLSLHDALPAP